MAKKTLDSRNSITEKQFSQTIIALARQFGWEVKFTWSSIHSPAGLQDLILCRPPRFILAELKTETGKETEAQIHWRQLTARCPGVEVYVWKPSDWDEIIVALDRELRVEYAWDHNVC